MNFTAEQIVQAEALADNLAAILGVSRETALRFADSLRPFIERGDSIEDAIRNAADERRRITMHVAGRRDTAAFKDFSRSLFAAIQPELRARAAL